MNAQRDCLRRADFMGKQVSDFPFRIIGNFAPVHGLRSIRLLSSHQLLCFFRSSIGRLLRQPCSCSAISCESSRFYAQCAHDSLNDRRRIVRILQLLGIRFQQFLNRCLAPQAKFPAGNILRFHIV